MRKAILLAGGLGVGAGLMLGAGAGLMYALDPDRGRRRRALLRDRATHAIGVARDTLDKKARDARNRARGLVAEAGAALTCEAVSDETLEERVRAQLGRAVSKPSDVEVLASEGKITLRGVVRAGEIERLLRRVSGVRGVREVESQLNVKGLHGGHDGAANGNNGAGHERAGMSAPARLLAAVAGSSLAIYGARRRGFVGSVAGIVGMRMLTRGLLNTGLQRGNGARGNGGSAE